MTADDILELATHLLAARAATIHCNEQYQRALDTEAAIAMRLRESLHGNHPFLVLQQSGHILEILDDGIEVHEAVIVDQPAVTTGTPATAAVTVESIQAQQVSHDSLAPLLQEFVRRAGGKRAKDLLNQHAQAARLSEVPADKLPVLQAALVQALGGEG